MAGRRNYAEGVKAALHVMCGGGCYRPECGEPAIRFVDGVPEINLQIAHIHALEKNGPREIRRMPIPERNAYANLIWLCAPCHKRVDADEVTYPAWKLKEWKRDRESKPLGSLVGLRDLDVAGMEELLHRAMAEIRNDMAAFTENFPELARLLRETIERLPSLDPESLRLLDSAANRLGLPDYAPIVHSAATRLDLPEYTPFLHHAAVNMELPEYVPMLINAAEKLDLANQVPRLHHVAETLRSIEAAYAARPDSAGPVEVRYVRWIPWKAAVAGLVGWAVAILLIYFHVKGHF